MSHKIGTPEEESAYIDPRTVQDMLCANNAHLQVLLQRVCSLEEGVKDLLDKLVMYPTSQDFAEALLALRQRQANLEVQAIYLKMKMDAML